MCMDAKRMVALIQSRGVRDARVLEAMERVPRHAFVPAAEHGAAYADYPLPIGHRQTISQPTIVAVMTEALALNAGDKVLEIGTGSGYQAAILAEMGMDVYTVERIQALHSEAAQRMAQLGYRVHCRLGDGRDGWPEHAPYQGILVTAAPLEVPEALVEQLVEGGRLVIPVGPPHGYQTLWRYQKVGERLEREDLGGVAFVPFVSDVEDG